MINGWWKSRLKGRLFSLSTAQLAGRDSYTLLVLIIILIIVTIIVIIIVISDVGVILGSQNTCSSDGNQFSMWILTSGKTGSVPNPPMHKSWQPLSSHAFETNKTRLMEIWNITFAPTHQDGNTGQLVKTNPKKLQNILHWTLVPLLGSDPQTIHILPSWTSDHKKGEIWQTRNHSKSAHLQAQLFKMLCNAMMPPNKLWLSIILPE